MKNLKTITGILAVILATLVIMSCKDGKKEHTDNDAGHSEMPSGEGQHHDDDNDGMKTSSDGMDVHQKTTTSSAIVNTYLQLKDALVADNNEEAQKQGGLLMDAFKRFDVSKFDSDQQKELKDIIVDASENAEHISESPIAHQREHFKQLSIDVNDMIAITGTPKTLYQQFCPMYDNGSAWLSASKEIKNPYYGSKMLSCGKVQREITK